MIIIITGMFKAFHLATTNTQDAQAGAAGETVMRIQLPAVGVLAFRDSLVLEEVHVGLQQANPLLTGNTAQDKGQRNAAVMIQVKNTGSQQIIPLHTP